MKKKGSFLAEETLKLIVALLVISLLSYFLISLYFAKMDNQNLKKAKATVDHLSTILESLSTSSTIETPLLNPSGWYLFSFIKGEQEPLACEETSCICLCKKKIHIFSSDIPSKDCSDKGVCEVVKNIKKFNPIKIKDSKDGLTEINIIKKGSIVIINEIK